MLGANELCSSEVTGLTITKMLAITLSFLLSLTALPLLFGIIWYERFGTDSKRTLMNQLVSSICWHLIFSIVFLQLPMTTLITIQKPISHGLCAFLDFTGASLYNFLLGKINSQKITIRNTITFCRSDVSLYFN